MISGRGVSVLAGIVHIYLKKEKEKKKMKTKTPCLV